jgi:cytochrome c oxidase subunit 2
MPAGAKWLVQLDSADVIHDFWVPQLAPKMDVVPGHTNFMWLEASKAGKYDGTCAEYCGCQHAWMRFSVIAESQQNFDAWMAGQSKPATAPRTELAQQGLNTFRDMSCINCHSISGASTAAHPAPDLTHFADRDMMGGGILSTTDANLHAWLKDPQAIKPGCLMPNLKLTDDQLDGLVSYLRSLN